MKNEKIYSIPNKPISSLYYYLMLEENDIVAEDCYLKFCSAWAEIVPDSKWIGKTQKEILENNPTALIAKRFDN
jgi:hypothetical protein